MQMNFQPSDFPLSGADASTEEHQTNPFTILHHAIRGRYAWAISLAAVLGAAGGIGGYFLKKPTYRSVGLVQIHSRIPKVLYTVEENQRLDMFDSVVAAEATYIQSARVLEAAGNKLDFYKSESSAASDSDEAGAQKAIFADWPSGPDGVYRLKQELTVSHKRNQEIITVSIEDENPKLAMAAVNMVIDKYQQLYGEKPLKDRATRDKALNTRKRELESKINNIESQILKFTKKYNTDDLDPLRDAEMQNLLTIRKHLSDIAERLLISADEPENAKEPSAEDSAKGSAEAGAEEDAETSATMEELSKEVLATVDNQLAELIAGRNRMKATFEASCLDYGPSHYKIKGLERDIASLDSQIKTRTEELRKLVASGQLTLTDQQALFGTANVGSMKSLQEMKKQYEKLKTDSENRLGEISNTSQQIASLREEQGQKKRELDSVVTELESIKVEDTFISKGRISITKGNLPNRPASDKRMQLAVLGGGAGVCAGLGLIWLFGVLKPSYRYIDELERAHDLVILGTLPDLTKPQAEQKELAALSIHNLRNLLSLRSKKSRTQPHGISYMITSARPGEGKTSLILALGMSFASEGCQTVLVDCDLVGRGLSRSLNMNDRPGLTEVLHHDRVDGEVQSTEVSNMWVLPAGCPDLRRPEELSLHALVKVVDGFKKNFEVVLIDTGPLMGSLEANLAASVADETILVVQRGQDPKVIQASLKRLEQLGGHCSGLVFNRALPRDLESSVSQVSFQSQSLRHTEGDKPSVKRQSRKSTVETNCATLAQALTEVGGGNLRKSEK